VELRHLRYFVAVAEELHFGHAALRLNTSQSSLSQQIQHLEKELKVALLTRTKRHVTLTPAGDRFLQEARGILVSADRAAGLAREAERGESWKLVLGISPETDWQFLGPALRVFSEHVPSPRVLFQNLTTEEQVAALREGRIDVGFVWLPLDVDGLTTEVTGRVRLAVALPESHPMASRKTLSLEDLSGEAYMLWPRHLSTGLYDQLRTIFSRAGFGPPVATEGGLPSTRTVLGMVAAGLTIALVDPVMEQMRTPGVVCRPLAGPGIFIESGVVYRRGEQSPIVAAFLDEMKALARETDLAAAAVRATPTRGRTVAAKARTRARATRSR